MSGEKEVQDKTRWVRAREALARLQAFSEPYHHRLVAKQCLIYLIKGVCSLLNNWPLLGRRTRRRQLLLRWVVYPSRLSRHHQVAITLRDRNYQAHNFLSAQSLNLYFFSAAYASSLTGRENSLYKCVICSVITFCPVRLSRHECGRAHLQRDNLGVDICIFYTRFVTYLFIIKVFTSLSTAGE